MLKAESAGAGTPTATIGYKTAEMYVMDADGNNLKTINSYNNSSNTSSPTGEINTETLAPEACAVCGGSGMVTCGYCRGTGKGTDHICHRNANRARAAPTAAVQARDFALAVMVPDKNRILA